MKTLKEQIEEIESILADASKCSDLGPGDIDGIELLQADLLRLKNKGKKAYPAKINIDPLRSELNAICMNPQLTDETVARWRRAMADFEQVQEEIEIAAANIKPKSRDSSNAYVNSR